MNTKRYKLIMLLTVLPALYGVSFNGLAAVIAAPALPVWVVQSRNVSGMLLMALLAVLGAIAANWQTRVPCPLPQMLMSLLLGAGSVAMSIWRTGGAFLGVLEHPLRCLSQIILAFAQFLPGVTAVSFLMTLMLPRARRSCLGMAFMNLVMVLLLCVTGHSARMLLGMPTIVWNRYLYSFGDLMKSPYAAAMREIMRAYNGIPPIVRTGIGAALTLLAARRLYTMVIGQLRWRLAQTAARSIVQPVNWPVSRPVAQPVARPRPQARYQPCVRQSAAHMNERDRQLLERLTAEVASGNAVGVNLESGAVGFSNRR